MKWLITGDVHIHNYKFMDNHKDIKNYRLHQFLMLSDDIVKMINDNNVTSFIIAGDLFVVPSPAPIVVNTAKRFIDNIIDKTNCNIYIIPGNHDLDLKKVGNQNIRDYHILKLFESDRVKVFDNDLVNIDGLSVHFHGWTPDGIENKTADVLIAHDDIKGAWFNQFIATDHGIDTSTYKVAFVGHIHNKQRIGNAYLPGETIPHNYGDNQDTSLILFDTIDYSVTELPTNEDNKYLKFIKVKSTDDVSQVNESSNIIYRVMDKAEELPDIKYEASSNDIITVAKDLIPETYTEESKNSIIKCLSNLSGVEENITNLDVKLLSCRIKNFLSIKNEEINFTKLGKLTTIVGDNGSGKSTLFKFIYYMLIGTIPGALKDDIISVNETSFYGELELYYNNCNYKIVRGRSPNILEFYTNGNTVTKNTSRELEDEIKKSLGFINYLNIMFIFQESEGIFRSMNDSSRVSFISQFLSLNVINKMSSNTYAYLQELGGKIKLSKDNIISLDGEITGMKSTISSIDVSESIDALNIEKSKLEGEVKRIDDKITDVNNNYNNYNNLVETVKRYVQNLTSLNNNIKELHEVINTYEAKRVEALGKFNLANSEFIKLDTNWNDTNIKAVELLKIELSKSLESKNNYSSELAVINKSIDDYNKLMSMSGGTCPLCYSTIDNNHINEYSNKLMELGKSKENLLIYANLIDETITSYNKQISELESEINEFNKKYNDLRLSVLGYQKDAETYTKLLETSNSTLAARRNEYAELHEKYSLYNEELCKDYTDNFENEVRAELDKLVNKKTKLNNSINDISVKINNCVLVEQLKEKIDDCNIKIEQLTKSIENDNKIYNEINHYYKTVLTDHGLLVSNMLNKLADFLNNEELKVTTTKTLKNGNIVPTLDISLKVEELNEYIPYNRLSGGQTLLADLLFLKGLTKLTSKIGFIFMDELFKFFDDENIIVAADILKESNIDNILLIIHNQASTSISDNQITVKLTDNGSKYTIN